MADDNEDVDDIGGVEEEKGDDDEDLSDPDDLDDDEFELDDIIHGQSAGQAYAEHLFDIYKIEKTLSNDAKMKALPKCDARVVNAIAQNKLGNTRIAPCGVEGTALALQAYVYFIVAIRAARSAGGSQLIKLLQAQQFSISAAGQENWYQHKEYVNCVRNMFRRCEPCKRLATRIFTKYGISLPAVLQPPLPQAPAPPPPVLPEDDDVEVGAGNQAEHEIGGVEYDQDMPPAQPPPAGPACGPHDQWSNPGVRTYDARVDGFPDLIAAENVDFYEEQLPPVLSSAAAVNLFRLNQDLQEATETLYTAMLMSGNDQVETPAALRTSVQIWLGMQPVPQRAKTHNPNGTPNLTDTGYLARLMGWAIQSETNRNAMRYCIIPLAFGRDPEFWFEGFERSARDNLRRNCTDTRPMTALVRPPRTNPFWFRRYLTQPSVMDANGTLFDVYVPMFAAAELRPFFLEDVNFSAARQRSMQTGFERAEYLNTLCVNVAYIWNALEEVRKFFHLAVDADYLEELHLTTLVRDLIADAPFPQMQTEFDDVPRHRDDAPVCEHVGTAWSPVAIADYAANFAAGDNDFEVQEDVTQEQLRDQIPNLVNQTWLGSRVRNMVANVLGFQPVPQSQRFVFNEDEPDNNLFVPSLNAWGNANPALFRRFKRMAFHGDTPGATQAEALRDVVLHSNCFKRVNNYARVASSHRTLQQRPLSMYMAKKSKPASTQSLRNWKLPRFAIQSELRNQDNQDTVVLDAGQRSRKLDAGFKKKMQRFSLESFVLKFHEEVAALGPPGPLNQLLDALEADDNLLRRMFARTVRAVQHGAADAEPE